MRKQNEYDEDFYGDDERMEDSPLDVITQRSKARDEVFDFEDEYQDEYQDEFSDESDDEDYLIDLDDEDFSLEDRYSEEDYTEATGKKKLKKRRRGLKIFFLVVELICIFTLSVGIWAADFYFDRRSDFNENVADQTYAKEKITINEGVEKKIANGYTNIAVFGIDTRTAAFESGVNTDTIIIVSINNETKEVKMVSVYRDTYLRIADSVGQATYAKANSAYCMGGIENAISMLNTNLDLNIENYAVINFAGVAKLIDLLGGVDVKLTEEEVNQLNLHLMDSRLATGMKSDDVQGAGWQHLNGLQATTYCRIRYTTFYDEETNEPITDDFGRTARQRLVISKMVDKAKKAGVKKTLKIAQKILTPKDEDEKLLTTSFTFDEIMDMIPILLEFNIAGSQGFPSVYRGAEIAGSVVVPRGLAYNVTQMHRFLFDDKDYEPTNAVYAISDQIINITGIQSETESLPEDSSDDNKDSEE